MREASFMAKGKRRVFPPDFKADAVKLVQSGRSAPDVAPELDLTETALRAWVQRAEVDCGKGPVGALTTSEREELARPQGEQTAPDGARHPKSGLPRARHV